MIRISATMQLIHLPFNIPAFVLEGEGFFDKFFDRVLSVHEKDINFDKYPLFSNRYHLTGENPELIKTFFSKSLIEFLEKIFITLKVQKPRVFFPSL